MKIRKPRRDHGLVLIDLGPIKIRALGRVERFTIRKPVLLDRWIRKRELVVG